MNQKTSFQKRLEKPLILLLIVFIVGPLNGCIELNPQADDSQPTSLTISYIDEASINPFALGIKENIMEGLVCFDHTFQVEPLLSTSWTNPNDTTWRFILKENVSFHNGEPFTAYDVYYSLSVYYQTVGAYVKNVSIVDNHTIDIQTYQPVPNFLHILARYLYIYPNNYITNQTTYPVGTGPYKYKEYVEGDHTSLSRNENYWGELPYIADVTFIIEDDPDSIKQGLLNKTIDVANYIVDASIKDIEEDPNIQIITFPPIANYFIGFDMRENNSYSYADGQNPTANLLVRQAIYHAINITPLIEGPFQGYATPATQLVSPYIFGYNPDIARLEYNPETSRELLTQAGYPNGFNITLDSITIGYEYNLENTLLVQEMLEDVGINVTINHLSTQEYREKVTQNKNTSLWLVGWNAVSYDGEFFYRNFLMNESDRYQGYYNSGHYNNTEVNRLGVLASTETNSQERQRLLQEGFAIALQEDVMLVPLVSQALFILAQPDLNIPPRADLGLFIKEITYD